MGPSPEQPIKEVQNKVEVEKPVLERIPDKILEKINKLRQDKQKYLQTMLNVSIQLTQLRDQQSIILKGMNSNMAAMQDILKDAHKKLRLAKKTDYQWRFDGKESFIGYKIKKKS